MRLRGNVAAFYVMKNVRIVPFLEIDMRDISMMLDEYARHGEDCKPMDFLKDTNTELFMIMADDYAVGMVRKTKKLYRECHGKLGISIRPAERRKGYGSATLEKLSLEKWWEPTACVDKTNEMSIRMFEKAGWIRTGRIFDWKGDRKAIEFILK